MNLMTEIQPMQAVVALAGFPVGETYFVPWAQVKVPDALQKQIFPFCEDILARLRVSGCQNQGTINFLELLQLLRPFFWRVCKESDSFQFFIDKIHSFRL